MAVMVNLKHVKKLADGRWQYRRRVPDALKVAAGKSEWKRIIPAGPEAEMMRKYHNHSAAYERDMAEAAKLPPLGRAKLTPREQWDAALVEADRLAEGVTGAADGDDARHIVAEAMADKLSPVMRKALAAPDSEPPKHTLRDARNIYVKEKLKGGTSFDDNKAKVRLDRVMRKAKEAGLSPLTALDSLTRELARKVRDHMLAHEKKGGGLVSPTTVQRELNTLKAVINFGIAELDVPGQPKNPFEKLSIAGATDDDAVMLAEDRKRQVLPDDVNPDALVHAWRGTTLCFKPASLGHWAGGP